MTTVEANCMSITGDDTIPKCLVTEKRFSMNGVKKKMQIRMSLELREAAIVINQSLRVPLKQN